MADSNSDGYMLGDKMNGLLLLAVNAKKKEDEEE